MKGREDEEISKLLNEYSTGRVEVSFKKLEWLIVLVSLANTFASMKQFQAQAKAAGDIKKAGMFGEKLLQVTYLIDSLQRQIGIDNKTMGLLLRNWVRVEFFDHYPGGMKISEN